ncbi:MAG: DUF748 domain-containing protein [Deltaproteobacteria bacterium]|nr:DUF748 domain-containing protein [Deltaproteobacteria bacterium]
MTRWKKIALVAVGILAVLLLFTATVLPILVRNKAVEVLREATGRNVRIEKVSLNPLTLTASVQGFAVEEHGGGPFLSVAALRVSVSPASLYRRALVLSEVSIESPSLRIVRAGADRFNFSDIAERRGKEEKPKSAGVFPFVLNRFRLTGGSLDLDDLVVAGGRKHSIRNLEIALPRLSSLPAEADGETTPRISAIVNGAPLSVTGKLKPFSKDLESSVRIALQKLSLPELAAYVPQAPPVDLASGKLTLDMDLLYRQPAGSKPELRVKGLARLDTLDLNLGKGQPLLRLPLLEVKASRLEPLAGVYDFEAITLTGMELFVSRDRRGEWMFASLLKPQAPERTTTPEEKGATPDKTAQPSFSVASLELQNGRVHFRDDLPRGRFKASVEKIALALKNVANRPEQTGQYDLSLQVDGEIRLASQGSFTLADPAVKASIRLTGLQLQKGWPYLASYLTAPLKGMVDLSGEVAFSGNNGLTAEKGNLFVKDFSARYGSQEGLDLARLTLTGASFNQKANRLEIDRLRLSQGNISLSREADGQLSVQSLLVPQEKGQPVGMTAAAPARQPTPVKQEAAKPLDYRLKRIEIDRFSIAVTDQTRPKKPRFTLRDTTLSLADLSGPAPRPAKFRFASTFGKETPLQAAGDLTPSPFRYRGDLRIGRLPIRDFEAYYPGNLNLLILGGLLDAALTLDVALEDGAPTGSFKGNAGLSAFHAVDAVEEEDLLKWQRLQLDGIDGDLKPFRLAIGQVSLNEVYSRIIVRENGTLNLQNLIRKEEADGGAEKPGPGPVQEAKPRAVTSVMAPDAPAAPRKQEPPAVRIGDVTILDGTIAFTDKHLSNHFETTFYNLGGRISGLSSEASLLADVDLRGNLENHSPLRITGKINPLREDLFVDLKLSFTDIDLSPMSPYAETYLGYILKQGKLFLDLQYHIENKKLLSENRIRVDQFTFGDPVKSDKATSLPVKLGLALLKDRRGEIHLDVPVMGQIDDPKFNIWRIVFQVLKNLLVKAVTSPFSLLSSLFGGGSDLSVVGFSPGTQILQPSEEQKLESLVKGLNERPALKMSLTAYVDREKDAEGYRNELLNRKLKREKILALARERQTTAAESTETTPLSAEEYPTYLKAVYAKEKFPKPRNALGREIGLPDPEMVKLILAHIKVEKDELEDLARERMDAVMNFLIQRGKIPAERIFQKKDDIFKPPAKNETPKSRVELNAITP